MKLLTTASAYLISLRSLKLVKSHDMYKNFHFLDQTVKDGGSSVPPLWSLTS